jgi:hypothetical protein
VNDSRADVGEPVSRSETLSLSRSVVVPSFGRCRRRIVLALDAIEGERLAAAAQFACVTLKGPGLEHILSPVVVDLLVKSSTSAFSTVTIVGFEESRA